MDAVPLASNYKMKQFKPSTHNNLISSSDYAHSVPRQKRERERQQREDERERSKNSRHRERESGPCIRRRRRRCCHLFNLLIENRSSSSSNRSSKEEEDDHRSKDARLGHGLPLEEEQTTEPSWWLEKLRWAADTASASASASAWPSIINL
ncbi:hypothetical protein Dimus_001966 [Dionaea muscipula]